MNTKMILLFGIFSLLLDVFLLFKTVSSVKQRKLDDIAREKSKDEWIWFDNAFSFAFCLGFYHLIPCLTVASLAVMIISLVFDITFWVCAGIFFATAFAMIFSIPYTVLMERNKIAD